MSNNQIAVTYDAINFDGTERRAHYRTIAYREDILSICEQKDAAAILYQILYRWQTEVRRAKVLKEAEKRAKIGAAPLTEEEAEDMMWAYLSYNDFVRESGGAVAYNTVIRMLEYLITTVHLVERRSGNDPRYAGYEYRINKEEVKKRLNALAATPAYTPKVPKKRNGKDGPPHLGTAENDATQVGTHAQGLPNKGRGSTQRSTDVYLSGETPHNYSHLSHRDLSQGNMRLIHAEDAHIPHARDQHIIRLDAHRKSSAEMSAARVAVGGTARILVHPPSPETDTVCRAGNQQSASASELSTTSATFPQSAGKTASRRSEQGNKSQAFQATLETALSQEARTIYTAWCSLFTVPMPLTPATAKAAEALVKPLAGWCSALNTTLAELLKEIMRWLYATDKTGYYQRGVKLSDVAREFEGWQSAREREVRKKTSRIHVPTREEDPYSIAALLAEQNPGFFA